MANYKVNRDLAKCIKCNRCILECSNGVHYLDESKVLQVNSNKCVNCARCVETCPTHAIEVSKEAYPYNEDEVFNSDAIETIKNNAENGKISLVSMGNTRVPCYWDNILINASQVTNPSIDPLREPMETRTFLGKKNDEVSRDSNGELVFTNNKKIELETPIMFAAMSYGAISLNAHKALAGAAKELNIMYNCGEGGLHQDLYEYGTNTIIQVASGRFGVDIDYLNAGNAIEIKIGQGAKPGIGGHLPGVKITEDISKTRMIPEGTEAISPAPHHDIYSIEDLRQLIYSLKEATNYSKPVIVKVAAVNNIAAIASGIARSGADIIAIDGVKGGTGAAPKCIRDNVGIPIEFALASVDQRLKEEGIRDNVSIVVSGSIRNSSDVIKAIALGADACYIGTASLIAMGCHMCRSCSTGRCNWGIATQDPKLCARLNVAKAKQNLINLVNVWTNEIKEFIGGMGINSIEALRGNRVMLRGFGLTDAELRVLGIKCVGE